jgi:L-cysteine desulfidase
MRLRTRQWKQQTKSVTAQKLNARQERRYELGWTVRETNELVGTRTGINVTCETKWIQRIQIYNANRQACKNIKNSYTRFSVGTALTVMIA